MKKNVIIWLMLLCMLLSSCGKTDAGGTGEEKSSFSAEMSTPEFDVQNQYMLAGTAVNFQETENFLFGTDKAGLFLHYYDKTSGLSGYLCADPTCPHDCAECDSRVYNGASLSWYDGKLYWVAQSGDANDTSLYLWCNDLSGNGLEKVKRLDFENIILAYQPQQYMIHRGNLYILGRANTVEGTTAGKRTTLLSSPLNGSEEFTLLYDETVSDNASNAIVRFVRNSVYLSMEVWDLERGLGDLTITKLDVTTGEAEIIYEEAGNTKNVSSFWVTDTGEVYLSLASEDYGGSVWKVEEGKRTEIISWEGDHSNIKLMDGIAANFTSKYREDGSRIRHVDIKTYDGETIYSGELFPEGISEFPIAPDEFGFGVVGGDEEKIVFSLSGNIDGVSLRYTVMVELSGMKPTILWSNAD